MRIALSVREYKCFAVCMLSGLGLSGCGSAVHVTTSADDAISSVSTISSVDLDGPKVQAIVLNYKDTLNAGSVNLNTYDALSYANLAQNYDDPAAATRNGLSGKYPAFAQETGT